MIPPAGHAEQGPLIASEIIASWAAEFSGRLQALTRVKGFGQGGPAERYLGQAGGYGDRGMISEVLPAGARGAESFGEQDEIALEALLPQESEAISHAGVRRRQEFAAVRHGARQALAALGLPPAALLPDQAGAPLWPAGVVGSMTHCTGYRASAVALRQDIASLGIDAEPNSPLPAGTRRLVLLPPEVERARELDTVRPSVAWTRLLFCAKEAAYKAWYTLTGQPLNSGDVEIVVNPEGTVAAAISLTPGGRTVPTLRGRWLVRDNLLLVALAVPRPSRPSSEPQRHRGHP